MEGSRGNDLSGAESSFLLDEPTMLSAAANELHAPLALLRQLGLALSSDGIDDAERKRIADQLTLTSERALRLTRQLTFDPLAQQLIDLEPVNAMTLCQDVYHELSPLFTAHGRSIAIKQRSKIPLVVANRSLLQRVLVSFGDNALHYGGSDDKPVQIVVSSLKDRVRLGVRDYGPALPVDMWRRLDERVAKRSAVTVPRRPQTSGVGLVMSRKLAEAMGGTVGVTRHRDGATFYVDMLLSRQMSIL